MPHTLAPHPASYWRPWSLSLGCVLAGAWLGGCGGDSTSTGGGAGSAAAPAEQTAPAAPAAYAAHEWGLVAATYRDSQVRAVAGPRGVAGGGFLGVGPLGHEVGVGVGRPFGQGHGIRGGGKPVVYFHLDEGTDALALRVAVAPAGGGAVVEHFPDGDLSAATGALEWPAVRVTRGACRGAFPGAADPRCQTADHLCEASELSRYETEEADCVHVRRSGPAGAEAGAEAAEGNAEVTTEAGLLFYRTGPAEVPLPRRGPRGATLAPRGRRRGPRLGDARRARSPPQRHTCACLAAGAGTTPRRPHGVWRRQRRRSGRPRGAP